MTTLSRAIQAKEISSREVLDFYIKRIKQVNPALNAVVQDSFENAGTEAAAADEALANGNMLGPLHGVPMTIKDSFYFRAGLD